MASSKSLWSTSFFALLIGTAQGAPPKAQEKPEAIDISTQVRIEFSEGLRSPDDTTHEVFVTLTNTSKTNLTGPIAVTFDSGKQTEFVFDWYTDTLKDGRQYYGLVDLNEALPPNQTSRRRKLYLKTAEKITDADRAQFEVPLRVVRLSEEHVESKTPVDEQVAGKKYDRAEFDRALSIQDRIADELIRTKEGIGSVGLGENDRGELTIKISAHRRGTARNFPSNYEGVPVEVAVAGEFTFMNGGPSGTALAAPSPAGKTGVKAGGGTKTLAAPTGSVGQARSRYPIPVPIGVSTTNEEEPCASGTLGCRVVDRAGAVYALSNNHVYAGENAAVIGDILCQPGTFDVVNCDITATTNIANLTQYVAYLFVFNTTADSPYNYVDAAIGITTPQNVDYQTPTGAYGIPSREIVRQPQIGARIQKMGRTTFFTRGQIDALNVKAVIDGQLGPTYFDRCLQVNRVTSGIFGGPGDSGSLVVYQDGNRPVGLLFAGSSILTLLNPIDVVLQAFEVGIDDGSLDSNGQPLPFSGSKSGRMGVAVGPRNKGIAPRR